MSSDTEHSQSNSENNHETPIYLNEEKEYESCLVLCFEEHDDSNNYASIDTRIFVTYDADAEYYIINGKRIDLFTEDSQAVNKTNFKPFMFYANDSSVVVDFIMNSFSKGHNISYIMYNYNNLPEDASDITYDFMENNMDRKYEIAGFDDIKINRSLIKTLVRLTKNMFN
jgi:hypothetical protein